MIARISAVVISILSAVWLARAPDWEPLITFLTSFLAYLGIELNQWRSNRIAASTFRYPEAGRHGRNLLSTGTHEVIVDEPISLRAAIPQGQKLHLIFKAAFNPADGEDAGWHRRVGTEMNWSATDYRRGDGIAEQHFDAEEGVADLMLIFRRPGQLTIEGFEGDRPLPAWCRTLTVRRKG